MPRSVYSRLHRKFGTISSLKHRLLCTKEKIDRIAIHYPLDLDDIRQVRRRMRGKSVVVVGAGFAGLTAAWWLAHHGFHVIVLEARNRVGGRVWTHDNGKKRQMIERGGELIGRNHPTWLRFASRFGFGLSLITPDDDYPDLDSPMRVNGRPLDSKEQEKTFNAMTAAYVTLNHDAAQIHAHTPWTAPRAKEWDQRTVEMWIQALKHCSEAAKAELRFEISTNQAVPVHEQSYLGLLAAVQGGSLTNLGTRKDEPSEFWTDTEVFRCGAGNDALAWRLKAEIENYGGEVHLNLPVRKVRMDSNSACAISTKGKPHKADWVIVAIPPSCWDDGFLPVDDPNSYKIQMGPALKYFAETRSRFWIRQKFSPSASDDRLGMLWEGTDNQIVPLKCGAELTLFAGGDLAQKALDQRNRKTYFRDGIAQIYSDFKSEVTNDTVMNWPDEQWTRSGYSCPRPGQVTAAAKKLYESNDRLAFAGEHCCMAYFGYMESALQSGLHAAQLIARDAGNPQINQLWEAKLEASLTPPHE